MQPRTSIYAEVEGKSFAKLLEEFTGQNYTNLKESLAQYTTALDFQAGIFPDEEIPEIISNAMILERFKIEAIEIIGRKEGLSEEQKKIILNELFGDKSEYKKLYDKYYQKGGLVEHAQKFFKDNKTRPIFKDIIPDSLNADSFDITKDVFKNISEMKTSLGVAEDHKKSFVVSITAFDEKNLDLTMMGLLASDPRGLGAMLAVMGNKDKQGEIMMEKDNRFNIGTETMKGVASSAVRCLVVLAICAAFLYIAATVGSLGAALASGSFAAVSTETILGITAAFVVGLQGFEHIRTKVEDEKHLTKNITNSSVNTNAAGSGISVDDLYKFVVAPIKKGRFKDKQKHSKGLELKLLGIQDNVDENRRCFRNLNKSEREKLQKMIPSAAYCEVLDKFGISIKSKNLAI
jgi:hypothetical protein